VGAHRTGTTSAQNFLRTNKVALRDAGIEVFIPPETRSSADHEIGSDAHCVIVSDENMIGTMENNVRSMSLYPDIDRRVTAHAAKLAGMTTLMVSVRSLNDWWRSSLLYLCAKGFPYPDVDTLEKLSMNDRSWVGVINDLRGLFPETKFVVREHGWKPDNPKQFFKRATRMPEIGELKNLADRNNASPTYATIYSKFLEREDYESIARLEKDPDLQLFSEQQNARFTSKYELDLHALSGRQDLDFLSDRTPKPPEISSEVQSNMPSSASESRSKLCMLYIGKSGTENVRKSWGSNRLRDAGLHLCNHDETLETTRKRYGEDR